MINEMFVFARSEDTNLEAMLAEKDEQIKGLMEEGTASWQRHSLVVIRSLLVCLVHVCPHTCTHIIMFTHARTSMHMCAHMHRVP